MGTYFSPFLLLHGYFNPGIGRKIIFTVSRDTRLGSVLHWTTGLSLGPAERRLGELVSKLSS